MATKPNTKERKSLQTPVGRATFVHLLKPFKFKQKDGDGDGKERDPQYSVTLCFDAETAKSPEMKALKLACVAAAKAKFGEDAVERIKKGKIKMPWRDGDDYADYGEPFTDEGAVFVTLRTNTAPQIVDKRAKPIMKESEIYSGCYMRASFGTWAYDNSGNKGVTLLLNNVQKVRDGDKLSSRMDAEEEFEAVDDDDDDAIDDGDGDDDGI